jgi:hypothetical protein
VTVGSGRKMYRADAVLPQFGDQWPVPDVPSFYRGLGNFFRARIENGAHWS